MVDLIDKEDEIWRRLEDPTFVGAWRDLFSRCSWATAFQDIPFVTTWFRIYRGAYAPILICRKKDKQTLTGLLILAQHRRDGNLVIAGAEQAEYKC